MAQRQIKIIVVNPGKKPETKVVDDNVTTYQNIVGGHFQTINAPLVPGVLIGINEDGHRLKLLPNLIVNGEMIVGSVFFFTTDGPEFASLTDTQIQQVLRNFD